MQIRHLRSLLGVTLAAFAILLLISGMFSCKKTEGPTGAARSSLSGIGHILGSRPLSGSILFHEEGNSLVLDYNRGSKLVLIDRLSAADKIYLRSVASGNLVISSYGIVILDPSNNTLILMPNNDPTSLGKFEAVKALFPGYLETEKIFGTTAVNIEKS